MSFALNAIANTLFFSDDSMHNLYINYGKYDFIYNLPQTIYSILISGFIIFIFELLSLSEDNLIEFKQKVNIKDINNEKNKQIKYLKIKSIIFSIIGIIILLFSWYYISCFCAVYSNTQTALIKNIFISFITGIIYPFILVLIPTSG